MLVLTVATVHAANVVRATRASVQRRRDRRRGVNDGLIRQRLIEIGDDVVLVLDADRQPHHVGAGAGLRSSARR